MQRNDLRLPSGKNNNLIKMIERYEVFDPPSKCNPTQFYDKLHDEVLTFRDSVKDILKEMHLIKELFIRKITEVVHRIVP